MSEPILLICAPADSPLTVPGSTFDHSCSRCRRKLMMAPSGQAFLKEHPEAEMLCHPCYVKIQEPDDEHHLAGPAEQIADELLASVPNPRLRRN
jgi:hypothetical protein